jgi:hypothetical protein
MFSKSVGLYVCVCMCGRRTETNPLDAFSPIICSPPPTLPIYSSFTLGMNGTLHLLHYITQCILYYMYHVITVLYSHNGIYFRGGIMKQQKNDGCDVHQRVVVSVYLCICIGAEIPSSTAVETTPSSCILKQDAVYCSCKVSPRPPGRKFQPPGSPINQWRGKKGI